MEGDFEGGGWFECLLLGLFFFGGGVGGLAGVFSQFLEEELEGGGGLEGFLFFFSGYVPGWGKSSVSVVPAVWIVFSWLEKCGVGGLDSVVECVVVGGGVPLFVPVVGGEVLMVRIEVWRIH